MLYGPWTNPDRTKQPDANGVYPVLPGFYCITDPATFAAHQALLTPYQVQAQPAEHVLGGDNPANPLVTITLHFADMVTAQEVLAQVNMPDPVMPPALPDEVPMERALIVMAHAGLKSAVDGFIASLPEPQKTDAQILLDHAPNLEVNGTFAQGFKAYAQLSDAAWGQLIAQAVHLPL